MSWLLDAAGIDLRYGSTLALDDVGLGVRAGELLTIVGPSGSGKTSLLRVLGGFQTPSAVDILRIEGVDMRDVPPQRRPLATVFQHYALFPHLTVGENVEYGLRVRGVNRQERRQRAAQALALMQLPDKADRRIQQLSGGERQRVAFARALVTEPLILLLDEPMGALDERLRHALEIEIRVLQRRLGMTIIQVTHGREQALSMSDRLVVMGGGRVCQIGTPAEIFERPSSRFVAGFMGVTNIAEGRVGAVDDAGSTVRIDTAAGCFTGSWTGAALPQPGQPAFLAIHPERVRLGPGQAGANRIPGRVLGTSYQGMRCTIELETPLGRFSASIPARETIETITTVGWSEADGAIGPLGERFDVKETPA